MKQKMQYFCHMMRHYNGQKDIITDMAPNTRRRSCLGEHSWMTLRSGQGYIYIYRVAQKK